jgi:CheY-like chemotaxis protein
MNQRIILFADNSHKFVNVRKEFLEQAGYQVVVVHSIDAAKATLEKGGVSLAILDIRMVDDADDRDISGLILAKEIARDVPKIMLTAFPTWQATKDALGPDLEGIPPAVDFISKNEGAEILLQAVAKWLGD